ncbi:MAG: hypothetical protein WCD89_19590 [Anaerocolumna sp.]
MNFDEIQKAISDQKKQLDRTANDLKFVPEDIKVRQEKILQLVKEELEAVEKELVKYSDHKK